MRAFYNEIDRYCCDWLSNLMDAGHITPGTIDDRSIHDVSPDDVRGYERAHWFAGIAGWDYALNLAGWGDRPVWTGSCPCQPFSVAGKRTGGEDKRHLWPHWFSLVRECRPAIVFGENVAAAIGWGWLDAVLGDLEAEGYATGAVVLGAHSVGAPHRRNRLWFVAQSMDDTNGRQRLRGQQGAAGRHVAEHGCDARLVADADRQRSSPESEETSGAGITGGGATGLLADAMRPGRPKGRTRAGNGQIAGGGADGRSVGELGIASSPRLQACERYELSAAQELDQGRAVEQPGRAPWADCVWLPCTDGKARPTQPGLFPLAARLPNRVAQLRAAGNSIVPQVAAEFIKASAG